MNPNTVGPNVFTVSVIENSTGKPTTNVGVSLYTTHLDMDMGTDTVNLQPDGKGHFSATGDLVMGDDNGVVVVPREHVEAVLQIATECRATEERIVEAIRGGVDPIEAHERVQYDQMTAPQND